MNILYTVTDSIIVSSCDPLRKIENTLLLNKLNNTQRTPKKRSPTENNLTLTEGN